MHCVLSFSAPDVVVNLQAVFIPFNETSGCFNVTWTPPSSYNGLYYQILYYSFSSAYSIGPLYSGSSSVMLDQGEGSYYVPSVLYYTNYTITITTINIKYNFTNGPVEIMTQTSAAGMYKILILRAWYEDIIQGLNLLYIWLLGLISVCKVPRYT